MIPKRVLHYGALGGVGGVETFLINIYRHIDPQILQFDFLTAKNQTVAFSDEIMMRGGDCLSCYHS